MHQQFHSLLHFESQSPSGSLSEGDHLSVIKIAIKESQIESIQSVAALCYQRGHQDAEIPICMATRSPESGLF